MKTVTISQANALQAYNKGNKEIKSALENLMPDIFPFKPITDRVKSFVDVCEIADLDITQFVTPKDASPEEITALAFRKLMIIARVLNEGWEPNWDDNSEYKYYPYMKHKTGSGFSLYDVYYACSASCVPSRLCFHSESLAQYAATQFGDIYAAYFNL